MSTIFVNSDWSAIVPAGSPDAAFGVQARDAKRLGVDKLPVLGGAELPEIPEAETAEAFVLRSASLIFETPTADTPDEDAPADQEPDTDGDTAVKEAATPANKAAAKPATKAARKDHD